MKKMNWKLFAIIVFFAILLVGCGEEEQKVEEHHLTVICVCNNGNENIECIVKDAANYQLPTVEKEGYTFVEWYSDEDLSEEFSLEGIDLSSLSKDISINAYAKWKINKYQVTFKADGITLNQQRIEYGKSANAPQVPEKSGYNFVGWDYDHTCIKGEVTINAIYEARPLTITYINLIDGTEIKNLEPNQYNAGETVELPLVNIKEYEFEGWYLSEISLLPITEINATFCTDLKIYARFTELKLHKTYTLPEATYHITKINKVPNGNSTYVYQPELPAGAPSGLMNYDWTTSDATVVELSTYSTIFVRGTGVACVTGTNKTNKSITVNYLVRVTADGPEYVTEEQANQYITHQVTYKDKDGNVIKTQTVMDGGCAINPVAPKVEGYSFSGWDKQCYNIKEDTVITATYEQGNKNPYAGKSFAIIGDSISTFKNYIPDGFSCFYPYATGDTNDYNQTWWMQTINRLNGQLLVNNSYSGSCVCGTGFATNTDKRLAYTVVQGKTPDVIIIYMGSNDGAAKYEKGIFKTYYKTMIEKLKVLCPDSEIILMELAISKLYTNTIKDNYNSAINELATEFGCKVIPTGTFDLSVHLLDSAHPYTSGMTAMADVIVNELTK